MSNPVVHFELMGKDAIGLQKFYADVFDWKLGAPQPEFGNYSLLDIEGNDCRSIAGGLGEGDPRVTVYIEVDDPQAYLDKAVRLGAKELMPVTTIMEGTTIAMFSDPAGNITGILKAQPR